MQRQQPGWCAGQRRDGAAGSGEGSGSEQPQRGEHGHEQLWVMEELGLVVPGRGESQRGREGRRGTGAGMTEEGGR